MISSEFSDAMITIYPLHQRLAGRLGGNQGRAATVIVVVGVLLIGALAGMVSAAE